MSEKVEKKERPGLEHYVTPEEELGDGDKKKGMSVDERAVKFAVEFETFIREVAKNKEKGLGIKLNGMVTPVDARATGLGLIAVGVSLAMSAPVGPVTGTEVLAFASRSALDIELEIRRQAEMLKALMLGGLDPKGKSVN